MIITIKGNNYSIKGFIQILCLSIVIYSQLPNPPSPQLCQNYYNSTILPLQCSSQLSCYFNQGLLPLIVNQTQQQPKVPFSLCIILKNYNLFINTQQNTTDSIVNYQSVFILSNNISIGIHLQSISSSNLQTFNYLSQFTNNFIITAQGSIQIYQASIIAMLFWAQAMNNVTILNSTIQNQSSLQSSCTCYLSQSTCYNWNFTYPYLYQNNNTFDLNLFQTNVAFQNITFNCITIMSYNSIYFANSLLQSSVIGVFTTNLDLSNSSIQSDGLGYASDLGEGCGFFDQLLNQLLGCTGSGGSHGGWGGNSSPNNCNLMMSNAPYGSLQKPYAPGSGGGFFFRQSKQVSSGGGIIHIQVLFMSLKGSNYITSNGTGGMQGGGGGSGGVVAIDYSNISNNGLLTMAAQGGKGKSSGGGGRIRLFNHLWRSTSVFPTGINISVAGGGQCNSKLACGTKGSVYTSPCTPGYELNSENFICQSCSIGYYQITYGYSNCSKCYFKPYNSYYNSTNTTASYLQACTFACDDGFIYKDGSCMTQFQSIMYNIGGINVLICLAIIVIVIILYVVVIMVRRMTMKEAFWSTYQELDKYSSKKYFQVQDIPYHQIRLYLSGRNQPFDPWKIDQKYTQNIFQQSSILLNRVSHLIKPVFKTINQKSVYNNGQIFFLMFLKFYYYPVYRFVKDYMKTAKANSIFRAINRLDSKIPQSQNIAIKFHVKPNITVGCIQIFDFTRSVYDYYIDNYFPLIFQLEKIPLGDFTLDFTDPFLKALMSSLVQGQQKNKQLVEYFQQLNALLRCCQQVLPILSHLWTITELVPHVQAYLWQPPDVFIGVQNQYRIDSSKQLFLMFTNQKQGLKKHFLHQVQLHSVHYDQITLLKHKFNLRKQTSLSPEKKIPIWEIQTNFSQKVLVWIFGISNILLLILCIISLFVIIFIISEDTIKFYYGIIVYFIILPFADFGIVFINFKAMLVKSHKIIAYSIIYSISVLIKYVILTILALIQLLVINTQNQNSALVDIIFGVWLAQFFLNWIILAFQMMLNPLFLKGT